jgi:hypothetical protein
LSEQKQPNKYWQRLPDNEIYLRDWTLVFGQPLSMLEELCLKATRNVAKELFLRVLGQVEKRVLAKEEGERKDHLKSAIETQSPHPKFLVLKPIAILEQFPKT